MWFNRHFLGELLADWRASQRTIVEATKATADAERRSADHREAMLLAQFQDAVEKRDDAMATAEVHFKVLAERIQGLEKQLAVAEAERKILSDQLQIAQNNYEWARLRLNQVEQERSILLDRYAAVQIPAMQLVRQPAAAAHGAPAAEEAPPENTISGLAQGLGMPLGMFEDLGDEEARRQGYSVDDSSKPAETAGE